MNKPRPTTHQPTAISRLLSSGFTLIELLVVIAIIGILATLVSANVLSSRDRARDARRKADLNQIKNALQLYYGDYQRFPTHNVAKKIFQGCVNGSTPCPTGSTFSAGTPLITYMAEVPEYAYYEQTNSGDGFILGVELDNAGDPEILTSQTRCGYSGTLPSPNNAYFICVQ